MIKIQLIEMTAVQVLMWFFKEQKSMPLLRETYVSTKPYHSYRNSQNLKWEKRYLSFEEYINASVKSRGFEMVLEQFLRDYENTVMQKLIMTKLGYRNYTNQCNALKNRFAKLMKKWKYFVNHNVFSDSLKVGDKYYYLEENGKVHTEWLNLGDHWYYLGTDGIMKTRWQLIGKRWFYFDAGGPMLTGWRIINGIQYYLQS